MAEAHVDLERAGAESARWHDLAQAKGELLLLKHKLHRERVHGTRPPSREVGASPGGVETPPSARSERRRP